MDLSPQGVYRRHLSQLVLSNFPEHFGEIVGLLLVLTESHAVEPELWCDVIQALMSQGAAHRYFFEFGAVFLFGKNRGWTLFKIKSKPT